MTHFQVAFHDGGAVCFEEHVRAEGETPHGRGQGHLAALFMLARRSVAWLRSTAQHFDVPVAFGRIATGRPTESHALESLLEAEYRFPLASPFEGCDSIAGGLCSGKRILGVESDDALAKLKFLPQTIELPIHTHEHSDRFIIIGNGEGTFYYSTGDLESFDGTHVLPVRVSRGDVVVFLQNVLHTFGAGSSGLTLFSYHAPEIAFDDPRQYSLPKVLWSPDRPKAAEMPFVPNELRSAQAGT